MQEQLLTTGEVARLLGTSRQHVVDLCDRGALRCLRTPKHRRVRRSDAQSLLERRPVITREDLRSLWLNRAVAAHLARDPQRVLAHAARNLDRLEAVHRDSSASRWLERWREVIAAGPERAMEVLTSVDPEAAELRQNSPFAGVLSEAERRQILDSFAKWSPPRN